MTCWHHGGTGVIFQRCVQSLQVPFNGFLSSHASAANIRAQRHCHCSAFRKRFVHAAAPVLVERGISVPKRPFAHQHLPRGIHAHHMQDRLCHVAPQYARILFHRTRRLLSGMMVSNAASVWLLEAMLPTQVHGMSADQSGIHHGIKWLSGAMPRPHETDKAFPLHTGSMGRLGHAQQSRGRRPILTIRDNNYATSTTTVGPCCVPAQSHPQGQ